MGWQGMEGIWPKEQLAPSACVRKSSAKPWINLTFERTALVILVLAVLHQGEGCIGVSGLGPLVALGHPVICILTSCPQDGAATAAMTGPKCWPRSHLKGLSVTGHTNMPTYIQYVSSR